MHGYSVASEVSADLAMLGLDISLIAIRDRSLLTDGWEPWRGPR
jgi:hypothetical protein